VLSSLTSTLRGNGGRLPRLAAAALCLVLAAASAAGAHRPRSDSGVPVVVARRAVAAGARLVAADLHVTTWPAALVPAGSVRSARTLVGQRVAGRVVAREAITRARLVGRDLTAGLATGETAVAVPVDATVTGLVEAGDRVDVLAVPSPDDSTTTPDDPPPDHREQTQRVAIGARVLAVLPPGEDTTAAIDPPPQLLIAATPATAATIATGVASKAYAVVLDPP
jgi:Flp pilus assembly protein CpaB